MENIILIIVCFLLGIFLRATGRAGDQGAAALNQVILYMSLPATALLAMHRLTLTPELIWPMLMAWIVFCVGFGVFTLVGRWMGLDRKTTACLALTAGLGNTSFVGLPMIEAYYGLEWVGIGLVCDQPGSFLTLATLGIILASSASGKKAGALEIIKRVILFPPLIAVAMGLLLQPVPFPAWLDSMLDKMGGTLSPLALLSVGMSLRFGAIKGNEKLLALGLGYKLLLAPLFIAVLYGTVLGLDDTTIYITIFEAGMPPMVMGGVIASMYGLRSELAALLLGVGIPLSFLTLPLWYEIAPLF